MVDRLCVINVRDDGGRHVRVDVNALWSRECEDGRASPSEVESAWHENDSILRTVFTVDAKEL